MWQFIREQLHWLVMVGLQILCHRHWLHPFPIAQSTSSSRTNSWSVRDGYLDWNRSTQSIVFSDFWANLCHHRKHDALMKWFVNSIFFVFVYCNQTIEQSSCHPFLRSASIRSMKPFKIIALMRFLYNINWFALFRHQHSSRWIRFKVFLWQKISILNRTIMMFDILKEEPYSVLVHLFVVVFIVLFWAH